MTTPLLTAGTDYVYHAPAERLLRWLPDNSIDLIVTDPPFNIGKATWDTWESVPAFIAWLDAHLRQMRRVLKPNGSLYLFCATKYSSKVETAVEKHFNVLNNIRWSKPYSRANGSDKDGLRAYFPAGESIIFADQYGSDDIASGEAGYVDAELALKRRIWGNQIKQAMDETNTNTHELTEALKAYQNHNHGGAASNWLAGYNIPTIDQYKKMRDYMNRKAGATKFLLREYEDLRREYEDLRREYEDLRRPFNGSPELPYTDVWEYETVNTYPGKHPCEKPLDMMRDIIRISSREGAIVLDPFCGSGSTLVAAKELKRRYIGGDFDQYWVERTNWRLQLPQQLELFLEATA